MMMQAQRQDAVIQVITHLANTVVSNVNMWGASYDSASPESTFQGMIEQATTPLPYSALSTFPLILRIIATIIFLALTVRFLIYPLISLIKVAGDTTLGWAEAAKTIFLPASFTALGIMKQYKTIASLTTGIDTQPMIPLQDTPTGIV